MRRGEEVLREALDAVATLRSLATTLGDTDEAQLEDVWPLVDFATCSGYRLNVAVRSRGWLFRTPSARSVKLSNKSIVEVDAIHGVFYTSAIASPSVHFIICLHRASPLGFLTLGGKIAVKGNDAIVLDYTFEMSFRCHIPPELLELRTTFVSWLISFFTRRREHLMQAQLFKNQFCQKKGSVLSTSVSPSTMHFSPEQEQRNNKSIYQDRSCLQYTSDQCHPRA